MLYAIKNKDDLEILEQLVSLEIQVKTVRLQDKLGKQNFHEDVKKLIEPVTDSLENASEKLTKTITFFNVSKLYQIVYTLFDVPFI